MAVRTRQPSSPSRTGTTWPWPAPPSEVVGGSPSLSAPIRLLRFTALAALLAAGMVVCVVLAGMAYLGILASTVDVPPPRRLAETTFLFDRGGERLARLHGAVDRTVIPFERMPGHLRGAVLAAEDKGFYVHGGIDVEAILRAAITDLKEGAFVEGGSTITQQYVKNVFTSGDRTLSRKLEEAALSIELERRFSKDEILERYLNTIYFGHGAYGVQAAARTYFGIPARELGVLQSATLAGLIAGPARFDPVRHPQRAERRRDYVLSEMVDMGFSQHRAEQLSRRPLRLDLSWDRSSEAPYFTDVVQRYLFDRYGRRTTLSGGLRVETTLDLGWQRAAERAVREHLSLPGDPAAALVAIDPRTGEIRALVGGTDFATTKFNLATQAARQTGSAFKPFVLAAALREGISPLSVMSGPSSLTITDPRCETRGEPWHVANYADASYGTMSIAEGIANSVNTIYSQLALKVGPEAVVRAAHRLGIDAPLSPVCSIALGVEEVTPLDMTSAFATMAANGIRREPTPVQVVRRDGKVVDRPVDVRGTRALSRNDAATLTWALQGVVDHGTGTAATLAGRPVAGKTGTSQEYTNAWFCGYVPQLAACVWMGYPQGNVPMEGVHGLTGVTGGSIPAAIWHDFMEVATARMTVLGFPQPDLGAYTVLAPPPPPPAPAPVESNEGGGHGGEHGNGHGRGNGD